MVASVRRGTARARVRARTHRARRGSPTKVKNANTKGNTTANANTKGKVQCEVSEFWMTTYPNTIKQTLERARALQKKGMRIVGVQLDTYKPWYLSSQQTKSAVAKQPNSILDMVLKVGIDAFNNMKEKTAALIWYCKDCAEDEPQGEIQCSTFETTLHGHHYMANHTADVLTKINKSRLHHNVSINYDSYMPALLRKDDKETTMVTVFYTGPPLGV